MRFAQTPDNDGSRYATASGDVEADVTPQTAPARAKAPNGPGSMPDGTFPPAQLLESAPRLVAVPRDASAEPMPVSRGAAVPWNRLMREHGRRVVVSLVARGIGMERARELAQEAWMRIIAQHRAGRLDRLEMPGIVVAQANFLAQDEHRRRGRRARMGLTAVDDPATEITELADAITGPDLERRIAARQGLRRVVEVVDRSYPNAQRVFHLLYGPDPQTPAEVAEQTGLSVQRVRQILCELRKEIRRELDGGSK